MTGKANVGTDAFVRPGEGKIARGTELRSGERTNASVPM